MIKTAKDNEMPFEQLHSLPICTTANPGLAWYWRIWMIRVRPLRAFLVIIHWINEWMGLSKKSSETNNYQQRGLGGKGCLEGEFFVHFYPLQIGSK
ncbi:hypothetical protein A7K91_01700 [Paenibacillus oryzae]|uniref:Uncharacterized protein n=1 Tax=Paenibacillus oryzae TaxID=1844972 RepID=A0A1A5Y9V4_9BACL|nr:hypothetical protein A7K91_01700 [Paenibacillus oryzae]